MALVDTFWDPNNWFQEERSFRIYADDYANDYAIVDEIDYQYLVQWRWKLKKSKTTKGTKKPKVYLARSIQETLSEQYYDEDGRRVRHRIGQTLFLHTAIMDRTGIEKPKTNERIIVDHADGNEFNCRRSNLRYATLSFNRMNLYGVHEHMLEI